MSQIKEIIENPHWVHRRYCAYWNFLLQSYEGGIDYTGATINNGQNTTTWDSMFNIYVNGIKQEPRVTGNLFLHPKERTHDYAKRLEMSYYYNFCAPILDIYGNHLFKEPVIEDFKEIESDIDEVSEDIDRTGASIQEFRKEMAGLAQLYGHIFVVVDSPDIPEDEILSRQDQIERKAFPYLTTHYPQNVINWALDRYGMPYWVLMREHYDANKDVGTFDKNKCYGVQYRLWTRESWELYDHDYNLKSTGIHALGRVPIVCAFDKKSKKVKNFLGVSTLTDIAFIARDVYNSCSELRQILRDQTFAFLALQGDTKEYDEVSIGTGKGLLYPEGRNAPQYVSPPPANAEVYFNHIDRQVKKIFQLAKLEGGSVQQTQSAVEQSGASKAWDFNETNSALAEKAGNLEDAEMKIWKIYAAWQNKEFNGTVQYPTEFSMSSLMDDLAELEKETRLQLGRTFNIEVRKAIIKKKFPRTPDAEIDKMIADVKTELNTENEADQLTNRFGSFFSKNADLAVKT